MRLIEEGCRCGGRGSDIYHDAMMCLSAFLVSDGDIVHKAIISGFLPNALEILTTGIRLDKKEVLWALSNITGSMF